MIMKSALVGAPPLTRDDALIRKGLILFSFSAVFTNASEPFGDPRPPGAISTSWATSFRIGTAFAMFFTIAFTVARLAVRKWVTKRVGIEDWTIIPGALGALMWNIGSINATALGCLGKHQYDCTYEEIQNFFFWEQVSNPIFLFAVFTIKLSISLQNRKMTFMASKRWKVVHVIFITLFLMLIPLVTILEIFKCNPTSVNYSLKALGEISDPHIIKCINRTVQSIADRVLHMATDVGLLAVPIIIVARLQMAWKTKARLTAVFAIGGMSFIASIVRNVSLTHHQIGDMTGSDAVHLAYIFDTIDLAFAVIVANLPALNVTIDMSYNAVIRYTGLSSATRRGQRSTESNGTRGTMFLNMGRRVRRQPGDTLDSIATLDVYQELQSLGDVSADSKEHSNGVREVSMT